MNWLPGYPASHGPDCDLLLFCRFFFRLFLICRVGLTDVFQAATLTVRCGAGGTDLSSMENEPVTEVAAFFRRNNLPERHLHFFRFFDVIHQANAVAQP